MDDDPKMRVPSTRLQPALAAVVKQPFVPPRVVRLGSLVGVTLQLSHFVSF